jgi:hypothetical protein
MELEMTHYNLIKNEDAGTSSENIQITQEVSLQSNNQSPTSLTQCCPSEPQNLIEEAIE